MWLTSESFPQVLNRVADFLGISNSNGRLDVVADIARLKRVPLDSWQAFGAFETKRGKLVVCRVPMFGTDLQVVGHQDFATIDAKWSKGVNGAKADGFRTGLFLDAANPPKEGAGVLLTEGPKDAAALHSVCVGNLDDRAQLNICNRDMQNDKIYRFGSVGTPGKSLPKAFVLMFRGCDVVLVPDRDKGGDDGSAKSAALLKGHAQSVKIAVLPMEWTQTDGPGVRELLQQADGESQLWTAINDAVPWQPDNAIDPNDRRPEIQITTDEHIVNAAVVDALVADETIYQRGGRLVHVVQETAASDGIHRPDGTSRIAELPEAVLRDRLSAVVRFVRETENSFVPANPPGWCVRAVHACGSWPNIRPLSGITAYPMLRPDGTILSTAGYDSQTGMLYHPTGPAPSIPNSPTKADALAAVELLFDVVAEFPFAKPEHQAAWLAGLLTPAARHAFYGPSPLFLFDANAAGTGKGLLADVTSFILTQREMSVMSNPRDDDEARKRITSLVMQADPMILIDNVAGSLGCASLDAALTATRWKDRILGRSEMVDMPIRATWFATGNNVVLKADTSRRVCHIRIDSKVENPEEREGFKYPNLRSHVREHQGELLAAVLTILRAWFVAGKPDAKLKPWGSYEGWSGVVRDAVVWLGLPDPGETRQELRDQSDNSAATLRALIAGWEELDPDGKGVTAAKAIEFVTSRTEEFPQLKAALLEYCPGKDGKFPSAISLGQKLKHLTGRIAGGKHFGSQKMNHMNCWYVRDSSSQGGQGDTGCTPTLPTRVRARSHARAGDIEVAETTSPTSLNKYQWLDEAVGF